MKNYIPRPSHSLTIIILLTSLLMFLSVNLWSSKSFTVAFKAASTKDVIYQVFYTSEKAQKFTEQNSVRKLVKAGQSKVKINIPTNVIARFRLDFGISPEKLTISNLKLSGKKRIRFTDFNKFHFLNIDKKELLKNMLVIDAQHRDPHIVYKDNLDIEGKRNVDWLVFIVLATFYFFISWKVIKYLAKFKIEEHHSRIDIVFLSVFFLLLFVPMLHISDAEKSEQENRNLAKYIPLVDSRGGTT